MQVVHFPVLLESMARARRERLTPLAPFTLHVRLERGLYPPLETPDLLVRVTAEGTHVEAGTGTADATLGATATALTEFLLGAKDLPAFLESSSLSPAAAGEKTGRVLTALSFGRPWFSPRGEHR
jgi:hypothetical protein